MSSMQRTIRRGIARRRMEMSGIHRPCRPVRIGDQKRSVFAKYWRNILKKQPAKKRRTGHDTGTAQ